jgi:hypothetical protein
MRISLTIAVPLLRVQHTIAINIGARHVTGAQDCGASRDLDLDLEISYSTAGVT